MQSFFLRRQWLTSILYRVCLLNSINQHKHVTIIALLLKDYILCNSIVHCTENKAYLRKWYLNCSPVGKSFCFICVEVLRPSQQSRSC